MDAQAVISQLEKTLNKTLDIIEPINPSAKDIQEIEYLYKQLGKMLDKKLNTRVGGTGLTGSI